ncbi:hypothetical protein BD770DRAFT_431097 [Pilaira anomala]|nr:hypothetical protein BD770DRAFT_431097 [Pilaira anomala]
MAGGVAMAGAAMTGVAMIGIALTNTGVALVVAVMMERQNGCCYDAVSNSFSNATGLESWIDGSHLGRCHLKGKYYDQSLIVATTPQQLVILFFGEYVLSCSTAGERVLSVAKKEELFSVTFIMLCFPYLMTFVKEQSKIMYCALAKKT